MKQILLTSCGLLCVGLAILGIFLPVLPTTPFLLLASWLFLKSSPRLNQWLLNHPTLGPYIRNYQINKAIPLKTKIISIATLWATILLTVCLFIRPWWLKILLLAIAVGVTIHLLHFKTLNLDNEDQTPQSNIPEQTERDEKRT